MSLNISDGTTTINHAVVYVRWQNKLAPVRRLLCAVNVAAFGWAGKDISRESESSPRSLELLCTSYSRHERILEGNGGATAAAIFEQKEEYQAQSLYAFEIGDIEQDQGLVYPHTKSCVALNDVMRC